MKNRVPLTSVNDWGSELAGPPMFSTNTVPGSVPSLFQSSLPEFGSLADRLRTNIAPELEVEGDEHRNVRTGEPLTLVAFSNDPDNYPPRRNRGGLPSTPEQLYRTPRGATVQGAPGLRMSWMVYRGPARHVTFAPVQMKTWMDSRVWANSPWSPPLSIPEPPADGRWVAEVTFDEPGNYVLRAVASDGSRFTYGDVIVTVTGPPAL